MACEGCSGLGNHQMCCVWRGQTTHLLRASQLSGFLVTGLALFLQALLLDKDLIRRPELSDLMFLQLIMGEGKGKG